MFDFGAKHRIYTILLFHFGKAFFLKTGTKKAFSRLMSKEVFILIIQF